MNRTVKERLVLKKSVKRNINQFLLVVVLFLIGMIGVRIHPEWKEVLQTQIYEKSISFAKGREFYRKYFGSVFPTFEEKSEYQAVLGQNVIGKDYSVEDGFLHLNLSSGNSVSCFENGVIVYLDSDKLLVEQVDGVVATYYGIEVSNYKLYDYIDKGDILGNAKGEVSVSFEKNGEKVDYQKYL